MKSKGYSFLAGTVTGDVAKMLPKPKGLPVAVMVMVVPMVLFGVLGVLEPTGRVGRIVFAESGEMFPEDIEDLKKCL